MPNGPPSPDIATPPGTGGREAPPPGGQEGQSTLRVVPSAEETARMVAAKRAQETAKEEGPEEALREVAGQQPPVETIPEEKITMAGSDTAYDNARESRDISTPANAPGEETLPQEKIDKIVERLNEPGADRFGILGSLPDEQAQIVANRARELNQDTQETEEPENPLKKLTADQLQVQRNVLNASKKVYEEELKGELSHWQRGSVQDELSKVQEELDRVQTEIADRNIEEPAAETATATREDVRRAIDTAAEDAVEAVKQRFEELRSWTPEQLDDEIATQKYKMDAARSLLGRRDLPSDTREMAQAEYDNANRQWEELRNFRRQSTRGTRAGGTEKQIAAEQWARERTNFAEQAAGLSPEVRATTRNKKLAAKEGLEESIRLETDPVTKDALRNQLRGVDADIKALDKIASELKPEEEKKAKETAEAEAKTVAEESKKLRREAASATDLQPEKDYWKSEVDRLDNEINNLVKNGGDQDEINKKIKELRDARVDLKNTQEALKAAQERDKAKSGLKEAGSVELLREVSRSEYEAWSTEEQEKYLTEIARNAGKIDQAGFNAIARKIEGDISLSPYEMGRLVRYGVDRLLAHDRSVMGTILKATNKYPEITQAIVAQKALVEATNMAFRDANPNEVERILKFAAKYKGWLAILLAIIAAGAATAGIATGALAGVGAGTGALGAGGAGVWGMGRGHRS